MIGLLISWIAWASWGLPPSYQQSSSLNLVRSCTAYRGECRDLPAADLDPTVRSAAAAGRIAFVDEEGRLMEPTAEQLRELGDLMVEELWSKAQEGVELSTLSDGTRRASFPGGFQVHLLARRATTPGKEQPAPRETKP